MTIHGLIEIFQGFMLAYWACFILPYIWWLGVAIGQVIHRHRTKHAFTPLKKWPLLTVAIPMYNEGQSFTDSIDALLAVEYPNLELIVVDDGSTDSSFEQARQKYELKLHEINTIWPRFGQPLKHCYRSLHYPNLKILKQSNGGKASALNTALRFAHGEYFMTLDADCIPGRHSLKRMVQFLETSPEYAGVSGTVRLRNGCTVERGEITQVALPKKWLLKFQMLEYLRSFLVARLGMFGDRGLLIMAGAFSMFRIEPLYRIKGFSEKTIGEDFDVCLQLIQRQNLNNHTYLLGMLPDTTCWTIGPETAAVLYRQRKRWQRGNFESLQRNPRLYLNPLQNPSRWINLVLFTLLETLSPIVELIGIFFILSLYALQILNASSTATILIFFYVICVLYSLLAILVEIIRPGIPIPVKHVVILVFAAVLEPFAYRIFLAIPRIAGTIDFFRNTKAQWGDMERSQLSLMKRETV